MDDKFETQYERLKKMIDSDKTVLSEPCKMLVLQDFQKTFEAYFELTSAPEMNILPNHGEYNIEIRFKANRIKNFNVIK